MNCEHCGRPKRDVPIKLNNMPDATADNEAERLLILLEVAANTALNKCSPEAHQRVELAVLDVMDYFDQKRWAQEKIKRRQGEMFKRSES